MKEYVLYCATCKLYSLIIIVIFLYRQELFSVECQLLQNALEYQKHSACIQEWQRKRASIDSIVKDSQDLLSPSASHDSHVTQQPLPPAMSHDSHMTQEDSATNKLHLLPIMTRPQQLITMATGEPHSISPDSGTDIGLSGNHGNNSVNHGDVVMEPEEVSTAREEVATLVAEKQRLEALHRRLDRLLVESKTKMAETKQVQNFMILSTRINPSSNIEKQKMGPGWFNFG